MIICGIITAPTADEAAGVADPAALERLVGAALEHLPAAKAAALASAATGVPRKLAYEIAVRLAARRR